MLTFLRQTPPAPRLTPAEISAAVAAGEATLIDVREPGEIRASGTAKGALSIPLGVIAIKADPRAPDHDPRLSTDRPVYVFCASGGRSGMAAGTLRQLGYGSVTNLGGFSDWCAAGGAVQR